MPWSRLRSLIESRFAPTLHGHVTVHQARYRYTHEDVGRVWIAVDGQEVAAFSTHWDWARGRALVEAIMDERQSWGTMAAHTSACAEAEAQLLAEGEFSDLRALDALEAYLSLTVETALASPNPLQRALAMLDRRLGKRRLRTLTHPADEHALVKELYALRCRFDRINIDPKVV
ncbi:MAG: SF0329 family protein [Gemmatimonas sp.]